MISSLLSISNNQIPANIRENHKRFADLIRSYNHWNNRGNLLERAEVESINQAISESLDHNSLAADYITTADEWRKRRSMISPGHFTIRLPKTFVLERGFEHLETIDNSGYSTTDGLLFEVREENAFVDHWLKRFGFDVDFDSNSLNAADPLLFIHSLKMMFASKGTLQCIKLFFSVFFDEEVEIYVPKYDICYIDDNFILDSDNFLRDDDVNQEFSYVVLVEQAPEFYTKTLEQIYKPHFHPAGFKFTLKQVE